MNLSQIELLRILEESDFNLSKAADKMYIVQSAVSRQLQLAVEVCAGVVAAARPRRSN